ncbi:Oidioi.mRNA.OKI2018_I69.chr1.g1198.t1.cds [Oikopleura dioica]|uniref:Oidioi.mRNA.OKI2018_I69.chr1.g1198.t1.cds n=1 Tax=Oikopleura dioica TaxID=34765 RepID=A0ABN7SQZ1_OIKDI|nr:Oidioi.mRNA.OKI2018_I69.chr1.g1198.t1.cds [Oikopleura dioica]
MSDEEKFSQIACDCRLAYGFVSNLSFFNKIHQYDINKNVFNEAENSELNQGNATEDAWLLEALEKMKNTTTLEPAENVLFSKTIAVFIKILMAVGIPANLFLLIVTAMSKRRKNNLQRSSSILFSILAGVDILLFLISIIKLKADARYDYDFVESHFLRQLFCRSYAGIKVVCMLFSVMLLCATALFRFFHIAYPAHTHRPYGLKIAAVVLALAVSASIPIFMYQQVILIGPEESPSCHWGWRLPPRELCKQAEIGIPEFNYRNCSNQKALCHDLPRHKSEFIYWIVIVVVFILTPIGASIMAYCGLIRRLHSNEPKSNWKKGKEYDVLIRNIQLFSTTLGLAWFPVVFWRVIRLIPGFSDGRGLNPVFCEFVSQTAGLTPLISGVVNPFLYSFFGNVFIQDLEKIKFTLFRKIPSLEPLLKTLTKNYGAASNSSVESQINVAETDTVLTACNSSMLILDSPKLNSSNNP